MMFRFWLVSFSSFSGVTLSTMAWTTTLHRSSRSLCAGGAAAASRATAFRKSRPGARPRSSALRRGSSAPSSRLHGYQTFLRQDRREDEKIRVSYFTDVEGDKLYLDRYVDNSRVLTWRTAAQAGRGGGARAPRDPHSLSRYRAGGAAPFPYERRIDFADDRSLLVFGGDLWDKGGHDLYVARQLLDLRRRHPERVLWVLGNRDLNKLRIGQELGAPPPRAAGAAGAGERGAVAVPAHPGLLWFRGSGRVGDPDGGARTLPSMEPGERLRWILGRTMGSPQAMEHRRQELAWERRGCREDQLEAGARNATGRDDPEEEGGISDLDVVRSYQESCHPDGEMGQFLAGGLLAARVGPLLFVHGSLPLTQDAMADAQAQARGAATHGAGNRSIWDDLTFCMPWINRTHHDYGPEHACATASDLGVHTIEDWLDAVNRFARAAVGAWKKDIAQLEEAPPCSDASTDASKQNIWAYRAGYGHGRSHSGHYYSDLIQYGQGMLPDGKRNPTVVYNSFTPQGMPTSFLPRETGDDDDAEGRSRRAWDVATCTREFFQRSQIRLILTGHKPQGDMPSPIRVDASSWIVCADTSYSGDTKWFHDARNATTPAARARRQQGEEELRARRTRSNLGRGTARSFRGDAAVSEVLVELSGGTLALHSVLYHGVLSDGTAYESLNLVAPAEGGTAAGAAASDAASASVGGRAPAAMVPEPAHSPHDGHWWTKGICRDGAHVYYAGEGYDVWNYLVPPAGAANRTHNK